MMFKTNNTVLFQGDSITDANRQRGLNSPNDPDALGHGYVFHTSAELMRRHPPLDLQIYDRGISGDKVFQLADRWQQDCLDIKPDILSILVGINDYWHMLTSDYGGTVADYERDYDILLERTRNALPKVKLILGEPFLLEAGDFTPDHREAVTAYQDTARRLAEKYDALWVPYQQAFNDALKLAPAEYWAPDGVHPTLPGHMLMAKTWLDTVDP